MREPFRSNRQGASLIGARRWTAYLPVDRPITNDYAAIGVTSPVPDPETPLGGPCVRSVSSKVRLSAREDSWPRFVALQAGPGQVGRGRLDVGFHRNSGLVLITFGDHARPQASWQVASKVARGAQPEKPFYLTSVGMPPGCPPRMKLGRVDGSVRNSCNA